MVSIKDVAKVAGVSDKTVSRVVNREPNVKPATREKVEEAIRLLDYVPNRAARATRTQQSGVIGLLTDAVTTTPYSVDIIRGVQDAINAVGKTLLIANSEGKPDSEANCWRTFREHRIDGVVYATSYYRPVELVGEQPTPVVFVNCYAPQQPHSYYVVPDDYQGGYDAALHVIRAGHRSIAYITLNPLLPAASLRISAFKDAMRNEGIEVDANFIRPGIEGEIGRDIFTAYQQAKLLLQKESPPTAILCGNDEIALQVYCAAYSLGYKIPQDVAIMGFDDLRVVSEIVKPPMSTVALPYYEMGYRGAMILNSVLSGDTKNLASEKSHCPVVDRGSV